MSLAPAYPNDHNPTYFGLNIPTCRDTLDPPVEHPAIAGLRTPATGFARGFHYPAIAGLAKLYSGGTFAHWVTTSSFIPIYVDS